MNSKFENQYNSSCNVFSRCVVTFIVFFSHFQVIALKLPDGKLPSSSPDSYRESDLVTYAEAKNSSQPKPYIAAVLTMSTETEFKLGDESNSSLPTRRLRRSSSGGYYNGPLDPGTSYSVFLRIYEDKVRS